jgi:hypothetical protein
MKRTFALLLLAGFAATATPPPGGAVPHTTSEEPQDTCGIVSADALEVRGVRIGTAHSRVLAAFGKPRSVKKGRDTEIGLGRWQALDFGGLTVDLTLPEPGHLQSPPSEPYVWQLVITSSRWSTRSGLRVGQALAGVLAILGPPEAHDSRADESILRYYTTPFDGFFWVSIRRGKVVALGISEDWT